MRVFEVLLTIFLFVSMILTLFIENKILIFNKHIKLKLVLPGCSVVLAGVSILTAGFRFAMMPMYVLSSVLLLIALVKVLKQHMEIKKKHTVMKIFGIVLLFLIYLGSIALVLYLPIVDLPKPTGASPVGTITMDFTNPTRMNILTGETEAQKINVQVWYPSSDIRGFRRVNWMNNREAARLFTEMNGLPDIFGQLCLVKTNSYKNAPLSKEAESYPVILFSGGAGMFNGQNVMQMEELASNGYVVFAVSHPKDDFAVIYSDGSVLPYSTQLGDALSKDTGKVIDILKKQFADDDTNPEMQRILIRKVKLMNEDVKVWADDMSFVADQIVQLNEGSISSIFKGKLATSQFGIFGHSFGGAAAGQVCLDDSRFTAFINMDGSPFGDTVDKTLKQPFMVLETGSDRNIKFRASEGYAKTQKNYITVAVEGTEHMNFTDFNVIIPNIGKSFGVLGKIDSKEQTNIVNTYVLAFFNKHLKGLEEPILEKQESQFPEVSIEYH